MYGVHSLDQILQQVAHRARMIVAEEGIAVWEASVRAQKELGVNFLPQSR